MPGRGPARYVTTPDASIGPRASRDVLVAIDPTKGLNNGQPSAHAKWLDAAAPKRGDSVLHVGCGTGYFTRSSPSCIGDLGAVVAYDVERELVDGARANLAPWPRANVLEGDASDPRAVCTT